jgi:hypothetical protein
MKYISLPILVIVFCSSSYAQLEVLTDVQKNRTLGKYYLKAGKFDSAYFFISRYINNEKYTNPGDYQSYALCCIRTGDTANFIAWFSKAISAGCELDNVRGYSKATLKDGNALAYLNNFLDTHYEKLRAYGYANYDTALIKEVALINEMDQLVRTNWKDDSNIKYRMFIGRQIDSINYERVVNIIKSGRYPGFHNCGWYAGSISIIMMHITDSHDDRFQYIFNKVKAEVLEGNISPDEVATIADRHYTGTLTNPRSYYGHWRGRSADLYDCKNVDKFRAEIGIEDLKTEYERAQLTIPECYGK